MTVTRFAPTKWDPMSVHAQMDLLFSQITQVVQVRVYTENFQHCFLVLVITSHCASLVSIIFCSIDVKFPLETITEC